MTSNDVCVSEITVNEKLCAKCRKTRYDIKDEWETGDKTPTGVFESTPRNKDKLEEAYISISRNKGKLGEAKKSITEPCPMLPGVYRNSGPIDVMLVTESHGGAVYEVKKDKNNSSYNWLRDGERPESNRIGYFYAGTFHAYEIRKILYSLDDLGLNWYLTDLVKCYVAKENPEVQDKRGNKKKVYNLDMAAKHCFKNYLSKEIVKYDPKIIVIFGWKSYSLFKRFKNTPKKFSDGLKIMGNEMADNLKNLMKESKDGKELEKPVYLFLPFPSQSAANSWSELKTRIDKKYRIEKDNKYHPVSYLLKEIKNRIQ